MLEDKSALQIQQRLLSLSAPVIGLNVLGVLALVVDTAMCGRLPNKAAVLTALGFGSQIAFLLMVFIWGMSVGAVALVARAYGAKDFGRVQHLLVQSTELVALVGFVVGAGTNVFAEDLLRALGAEGEVVTLGLEYLRPLLWGNAFLYLNMHFAAILRGVGNTSIAFWVAVASNAVNVLVNYCLILGNWGFPSLGLTGAAYGTVAAQMVGALLLALAIRSDRLPDMHLPLKLVRLEWPLIKDLVRVSWPVALDLLVLNAGFLSIIGMLGRLDDVAVAAHGLGLRVQSLAFVPGMSISQATSALTGQALGAGSVPSAKRVAWASVVLCVAIMALVGGVVIFFAPDIVMSFDVEATSHLGQLSVQWIEVLGYGLPIVGVYVALAGVLQGAGDTKTPLWVNVFATLAMQVPLSWFLGFVVGWGPFGVWLGFPLSFVGKTGLGIVAYRWGHWAKTGDRL